MNDHANLLNDIGLGVLAAGLLSVIAHKLKISPILAYILAGVTLGPSIGLGWIASADNIHTISEVGLVLLMFILGLEIDIRKLMRAGKPVLLNGIFQFLFCFVTGLFYFRYTGVAKPGGNFDLIYLAVATSLSSTLVVVKILADRRELGTLISRITIGILVIQDLWVIGFLSIQPSLNDLQVTTVLMSLSKAVILVSVTVGMAKVILPRIFGGIAKQPELMLVVSMAWTCLVCGIAGTLGLSYEMGALVAGVSMAAYPYHVEIASKISSLRDFYIMLFFLALGAMLPKPSQIVFEYTAIIVAFVLVSRILAIFPVLYGMGYGNRASFIPALNLSQLSEFSLVIGTIGVAHGHVRPDILSALTYSLIFTLIISSIAIPRGHKIHLFFSRLLERLGFRDRLLVAPAAHEETAEAAAKGPKIVFLGFFRETSSLMHEVMIRYSSSALDELLVVDLNPEVHRKLQALKIKCRYGDISHTETLRHFGVESASVFVSTVPDSILKGTTNLKLLIHLKAMFPKALVIVTAETMESAREMYIHGASYVFIPRIISATYLADMIEAIDTGGASEAIREKGMAFVQARDEILP